MKTKQTEVSVTPIGVVVTEIPAPKKKLGSFQYRKRRVGIITGQGKTEQSHKQQCDINFILRDYQRTGLLKHAKNNQGKYDDITMQDFTEAMNLVTNAQQMFSELPSSIRNRFSNNPALFLEFVQNPDNKPELAKMGILAGNDGLDITGAPSGAPTKESLIEATEVKTKEVEKE